MLYNGLCSPLLPIVPSVSTSVVCYNLRYEVNQSSFSPADHAKSRRFFLSASFSGVSQQV